MLEKIINAYPDETFLKADGFDNCIIGVDEKNNRLIYSVAKCIETLKAEMSTDDAVEYFNFNIFDSYVGNQTPIWCWDYF
jgi:hypothetical protein